MTSTRNQPQLYCLYSSDNLEKIIYGISFNKEKLVLMLNTNIEDDMKSYYHIDFIDIISILKFTMLSDPYNILNKKLIGKDKNYMIMTCNEINKEKLKLYSWYKPENTPLRFKESILNIVIDHNINTTEFNDYIQKMRTEDLFCDNKLSVNNINLDEYYADGIMNS